MHKKTLILIGWASLLSQPITASNLDLSQHSFNEDCELGVQAYEETLFPYVDRKCSGCHDGSDENAPPFAVEDVRESYTIIKEFVNFNRLEESILIDQAGNNHCESSQCLPNIRAKVLEKARTWWDEGESMCPSFGNHFTSTVDLPNPLPKLGEGFTKISWGLGSISPDFAGMELEMGVQQFAVAQNGVRGAYRFTQPRVTGSNKSLHIKGIRILINGKYDEYARSYVSIDHHIEAELNAAGTMVYPILSTDNLITLEDQGAAIDKLSLAFEIIETAPAPDCNSLSEFTTKVKSTFDSEDCYQCHGSDQTAGTAPANARFYMGGSVMELCKRSKGRIYSQSPRLSALLALPLSGKFNHPVVDDADATIYMNWLQWIQGEL